MHFLVFLSVLVACAADVPLNPTRLTIKGRIISGCTTAPWKVRHVVSVLKNEIYKCGGSIINLDWVVTAAHCFEDSVSVVNLQVRYGSIRSHLFGTTVKVARIIQHPHYKSSYDDYDVALLQVAHWFKFSRFVIPVVLESSTEVHEGTPAVVSGWGANYYGGPSLNKLRHATVRILSDETCKDQAHYTGIFAASMICAGIPDQTTGPCTHDSGGPLIANRKLVGIVSRVKNCSQHTYSRVYTKVSAVYPWIETTVINSGSRLYYY